MDDHPDNQERESPIDLRAAAMANDAFVRVIQTGSHAQIAVMAIPPNGDIGEAVHAHSDQLFFVVDGMSEARVGELALAAWPGESVFAEAGTRHNIVNRAAMTLRLITVSAPPAHAPASLFLTKAEAEAARSN